ncbi:hypothetical protein KDL01_38240 [Actinospica durhamensis]|uniref:PH domain-containing protein n=1 Tax=Actinospica durhamensis TaxID=1508375 RepID=A0A941EY33_9ACTN|nr:hypothetical protein [Actinospica durhamensis]MBR7839166.1 hypothetical protein [Actinospica durhamensis]
MPVAPQVAHRRMWRAMAIVGGSWAAVMAADVIAIRTGVLPPTYTAIATAAGFLTPAIALPIWHGICGAPQVAAQDGRTLVSARTLTGVRTIAPDELVSVRRFEAASRGGSTDELRLRDRHGLCLALDATYADAAVRRAVLIAPPGSIKVSRPAQCRLGLRPRRRGVRTARLMLGVLWLLPAFVPFGLASWGLACLLVGKST